MLYHAQHKTFCEGLVVVWSYQCISSLRHIPTILIDSMLTSANNNSMTHPHTTSIIHWHILGFKQTWVLLWWLPFIVIRWFMYFGPPNIIGWLIWVQLLNDIVEMLENVILGDANTVRILPLRLGNDKCLFIFSKVIILTRWKFFNVFHNIS